MSISNNLGSSRPSGDRLIESVLRLAKGNEFTQEKQDQIHVSNMRLLLLHIEAPFDASVLKSAEVFGLARHGLTPFHLEHPMLKKFRAKVYMKNLYSQVTSNGLCSRTAKGLLDQADVLINSQSKQLGALKKNDN